MAVLLWARLAFLVVLVLLVTCYGWTAFRTREER
jgi:hypothetical protein